MTDPRRNEDFATRDDHDVSSLNRLDTAAPDHSDTAAQDASRSAASADQTSVPTEVVDDELKTSNHTQTGDSSDAATDHYATQNDRHATRDGHSAIQADRYATQADRYATQADRYATQADRYASRSDDYGTHATDASLSFGVGHVDADDDRSGADSPNTDLPEADSSSDVPSEPLPPIVQQFKVLRKHARGGLGQVYYARDETFGRNVAVKTIRAKHQSSADCRARFVREAEITGNLEHPSIVPVYAMGIPESTDDASSPFYAMRFIDGRTLVKAAQTFHDRFINDADPPAGEDIPPSGKDVAPAGKDVATGNTDDAESRRPAKDKRFSDLEFRSLINCVIDVCQAIAYAHSRGVIHRDLKPANILIGRFGETYVVDWGLAKSIGRKASDDDASDANDEATLYPSGHDDSHTRQGATVGTPAYMSPEAARGDLSSVTTDADIYGIGATLYFVLTGRAPRQFTTREAAFHSDDAAARLQFDRHVPPPLESIVRKAMSPQRTDRYKSATALAKDLERYLADAPVSAHRETIVSRTTRRMRRHRGAVTTATAAAILLAAISGVYAVSTSRKNHRLTDTLMRLDTQRSIAESQADLANQRAEEAQHYRGETVAAIRDLIRQTSDESRFGNRLISLDRINELEAVVTSHFEDNRDDPELRSDYADMRLSHAIALARSDDYLKAITMFDQAIELMDEDGGASIEDRMDMADALRFSGTSLKSAARYAEAIERYARAQKIINEVITESPQSIVAKRTLATILVEQVGVHTSLLDYASALETARRTIEICEPLIQSDETKNLDYVMLILASNREGEALAELGRIDEAIEHLRRYEKRGRDLMKINNSADVQYATGRVMSSTVRLALEHPDARPDDLDLKSKADELVRFWDALVSRSPLTAYQSRLAAAHHLKALYEFEIDQPETAIETFETSLDWYRRINETVSKVGYVLDEAETRADYANVLKTMGRTAEATANHRQTLQSLEAARSTWPEDSKVARRLEEFKSAADKVEQADN